MLQIKSNKYIYISFKNELWTHRKNLSRSQLLFASRFGQKCYGIYWMAVPTQRANWLMRQEYRHLLPVIIYQNSSRPILSKLNRRDGIVTFHFHDLKSRMLWNR